MGKLVLLGQNFDRDRSYAPVHGGGSISHPDIDFLIPPAGVHAIGDREYLIAVVGGNADLRTELYTVHGDTAIADWRAGGGRERVTIALGHGRRIGTRLNDHGFLDRGLGLINRVRQGCQGNGRLIDHGRLV